VLDLQEQLGTDWGEDGWFRIKYGECHIEDDTAYLIDVHNPRAPTISISTDTTSYTTGDQMKASVHITNPDDAWSVGVYIGIKKPDGKTAWLVTKPSVTLPEGFEYSMERTYTLPSLSPGTYEWRAILVESETGLIICEDTASWEFVSKGAPTEDIFEALEQTPVVIDFGE